MPLRVGENDVMDGRQDQHYDRFLRLYTEHEPALRAFVRRLVPKRSDAADVMQEVALVLWRKFDRLTREEEFCKWAFGVARYETLAWLRDKARDRHVFSEGLLLTFADEAMEAESYLAAQREALERCLDKMRDKDRRLMLAAYAEGTMVRDIAQRSGRSIVGFYQWLHRMRLRLLDCTRRVLATEGLL